MGKGNILFQDDMTGPDPPVSRRVDVMIEHTGEGP